MQPASSVHPCPPVHVQECRNQSFRLDVCVAARRAAAAVVQALCTSSRSCCCPRRRWRRRRRRASRPTSSTAAPCSRRRCDPTLLPARCAEPALKCLQLALQHVLSTGPEAALPSTPKTLPLLQGIVTVPGSGFKQADGTYHFRCEKFVVKFALHVWQVCSCRTSVHVLDCIQSVSKNALHTGRRFCRLKRTSSTWRRICRTSTPASWRSIRTQFCEHFEGTCCCRHVVGSAWACWRSFSVKYAIASERHNSVLVSRRRTAVLQSSKEYQLRMWCRAQQQQYLTANTQNPHMCGHHLEAACFVFSQSTLRTTPSTSQHQYRAAQPMLQAACTTERCESSSVVDGTGWHIRHLGAAAGCLLRPGGLQRQHSGSAKWPATKQAKRLSKVVLSAVSSFGS